ncbi:MAG: glycoside hydrolase [Planctomycetota bacterium]|jgi:O-glycosyl hydrolase
MKLFDGSKVKRLLIGFIAGFLVVGGSTYASEYVPCLPGSGGDLRTSHPSILTVTVNTYDTLQTIHNFGASDAWSIQFVGQWPLEKRDAIADLLFETGLDIQNDPKGIGLSSWRFNIGAGSSRQSNISDSWRRADTFLSTDYSSYDWWRLPGQQWFLQAAKARGLEQFIAFLNSPPINMTKNGIAYCDSSSDTTNLRSDKITDFAVYLATILRHFADSEGIVFNYISPFNEPNWEWEGGQEGCRYYNSDIEQVVDVLYPELQNQGLTAEIEIPEAGDMGYLYGNSTERGDYIDSFFNASSLYFIGNKVAGKVAGHSYFSCWPEDDRLVGMRETLRNKLYQYPGLEYWATEYCILIPGDSWVPPQHRGYGNGLDLGIDPALWVARVIHHDLTVAEASAWQWWLAVSPYDYKDGLVYIDKNETNGNYYESKMLWAMGNFSRFIRPGMQRVAVYRSDNATPDDTVEDLMVSAYYKSDDDIVVIVFVNWADQDKTVELDFLGGSMTYLVPYVTRGNSNTQDNLTAYVAISPDDTIAIPARSIVTIAEMPTSPGDCDKDGKVDFGDFAILAAQWRETGCDSCSGGELTGDGEVNVEDLAVLADCWLRAINIPPLPAPVSNPHPYDRERDVDLNYDLSWTAGAGAISQDVYFGTTNPPPFIRNQTATRFDPNKMDENTGHYWRIDEVNMWGTTLGPVLRFTTGWDWPPT